MISDPLHVVCATDANYAPHMAAMLRSMGRNAQSGALCVHVLHDAVPDAVRCAISREAPNLSLIWHSIDDHPALTLPPLLQISRATYLRLIMDEVLDPGVSRVIYLDIDVIVTGSLATLWEHDLGHAECAAVVDPGVDAADFAKKHGLEGSGNYFNAGVMLLDLDKIRRSGSFKIALDLLLAGKHQFDLADQDALNAALWGKWKVLDPTWNFQRKFLYTDFAAHLRKSACEHQTPKIIHFTEKEKPWEAGEWHPYAWLYWRYALRTKFWRETMRKGGVSKGELLKHLARFMFKPRQLTM